MGGYIIRKAAGVAMLAVAGVAAYLLYIHSLNAHGIGWHPQRGAQ